ncbi:MAG: DUF456 domain-containing protein [Candidatus Abyssobacteria bacterium SURF_5]|uniref:DUF456 domain-containing protein n=1 Tax=Abyssobacteria bacterium (strain SURF_5) TaxID=2093360 RepID=A0A3A4NLS3_ABYX5|nr:MAG: DUF456 domain-containing protein [Candidatus Abyssubacteria bacterium SURF_5]
MLLSIITYLVLSFFMLVGLVLTPLGLPGNWLILACGAAYGLLTGWSKFGWGFIAVLAAAALTGEIIEFLAAAIGARRYGSSRGGELAALAGSIVGAIIGAGFGFIVGSILGAFAGAFLAVFFYEYWRLNDLRLSARAGIGALMGKTAAVVLKEIIGVIMAGSVVYFFIA